MRRIDLNVDIAEGFPFDSQLLAFATSANVCCGVHAGSQELTESTVAMCLEHGVRVGAHPGFPDRESMGRREPAAGEAAEFFDSIRIQIRDFARFKPAYVKPHGALYNWLSHLDYREAERAKSVLELEGVEVMALPGSPWAAALGPCAIQEGFADRRIRPDGTLAPRTEPGAVLRKPGEAAAHALVQAPQVDTICLHGDTPGCLEFAEAVARALRDAGWELGW